MNERTDYAANRGPLDRREYVRRRPDPFSVVAGALAIAGLVVMVVVVGGILIGVVQHAIAP